MPQKLTSLNGDIFTLRKNYIICIEFSRGASVRATRSAIRKMFEKHKSGLNGQYNWYCRFNPKNKWSYVSWGVWWNWNKHGSLKIGCVEFSAYAAKKLRNWAKG